MSFTRRDLNQVAWDAIQAWAVGGEAAYAEAVRVGLGLPGWRTTVPLMTGPVFRCECCGKPLRDHGLLHKGYLRCEQECLGWWELPRCEMCGKPGCSPDGYHDRWDKAVGWIPCIQRHTITS